MDATTIKAAAKRLSERRFSAYHVNSYALERMVRRQAGDQDRFNQYDREDWATVGADHLDYEPGEEEDWAADHVAHFHLSLFVTFVASDWAEEHALAIAIGRGSSDGLQSVIENAIHEFVGAWADAREGR